MKNLNNYVIYLRKSRADMEAESRGEGETLARHENTLTELAKRKGIDASRIYKEIVSGETIASRPVMQRLLSEVESGQWAGVLVMEVERLARGDTMDQGFVSQAFKYSGTLIITPDKTYDPNNEFDEEYFEFGLFMSRREYKTINRRLQRGRTASAREGKYVSNKPPYGYKRIKLGNEKGFTLEAIPEQADIVRLIFDLYTVGEKQNDGGLKRLGTSLIARRLNELKIPSYSGNEWSSSSIHDILINPVYTGKIRWNWRPANKKIVNGNIKTERPRSKSEDYIIVDGLHSGIIEKNVFGAAREIMKRNIVTPVKDNHVVKNPLSGLVICGKCGRKMCRRPYSGNSYPDTLVCQNGSCNNVSSHLHLVESKLLQALDSWLHGYKLKWDIDVSPENQKENKLILFKQKSILKIQEEINLLKKQRGNAYDLLEQGIYDKGTFLDRISDIGERIKTAEEKRLILKNDLTLQEKKHGKHLKIIPKIEYILDVYDGLPSPKAKNDLLKEILEKVVYIKLQSGRWNNKTDDFELSLYPRLPESH